MSYLVYNDYKRIIQSDNLQQIISADDSIRTDSEMAAQEEIISYLIQKYNTDEEFKSTEVFTLTNSYIAGQTLQLNSGVYNNATQYATNEIISYSGNVYYTTGSTIGNSPISTGSTWSLLGSQYALYNAIYPEQLYTYGTTYSVGEKVYWKNKIYTCQNQNSTIAPDDAAYGSQYWGSGVSYSIPSGSIITNTLFYALGDARSQQMVQTITDITLYHIHSRIAPRNIPDIRVKRYDDAKKWLKMCYMGDVTPNLMVKTPRSGGRIRIGSNQKNINTY
jgi:hypothetical protein